jgi:hypothetical protein
MDSAREREEHAVFGVFPKTLKAVAKKTDKLVLDVSNLT